MDESSDASGREQDGPGERLQEAFEVLVHAVGELTYGDRPPTASAVRLALKRVTYNGFDHRALGFKRFRDFLQAAQDAGCIEVHEQPGDVVVALRGASPEPVQRTRIRRDLWKACLDWSPRERHYFDLSAGRVATLPVEPVPLEPEKFRVLRERLSSDDPALVAIPTIDIHTQIVWMEAFTKSLEDASLRPLLEGALGGDKPARLFAVVLRNEPAAQERWFEDLSAKVRAHLQLWKDHEPRVADLNLLVPAPPAKAMPSDARGTAPGARSLVEVAGSIVQRVATDKQSTSARSPRSKNSPELRLRAILHQAIDRMPEEELRRLRLPVGYLVED